MPVRCRVVLPPPRPSTPCTDCYTMHASSFALHAQPIRTDDTANWEPDRQALGCLASVARKLIWFSLGRLLGWSLLCRDRDSWSLIPKNCKKDINSQRLGLTHVVFHCFAMLLQKWHPRFAKTIVRTFMCHRPKLPGPHLFYIQPRIIQPRI